MEEKILIKSEHYSAKKVLFFAVLALTILALLVSFIMITNWNDGTWSAKESREFLKENPKYIEKSIFEDSIERGLFNFFNEHWHYNAKTEKEWMQPGEYVFVLTGYIVCLVGIILFFLFVNSHELTVTNMRIYGKSAWGKRVDIPQNSITAISTSKLLRGITASSASGYIKFLLIKNTEEIYQTLNELLIERQKKSFVEQPAVYIPHPTAVTTQSDADELKKFKELLDAGIITQEEFDTKKKQILG